MRPMEPTGTRAAASSDAARISALITLLADDDPAVGEAVSGHLRDIGVAALPSLREAAAHDDPTLRERAQVLVNELLYEQVLEDLRDFTREGCPNLEEGLYLVSRLHTPDLDPETCTAALTRMTEDLMIRLDPGDGADVLLSALSRYLHDQMGFCGNTDDYYNENNSYLHTLLASRKGIPISLSCLYLILARRLGLPLSGIGMPGHFLVKYDDGRSVRVVDPFRRGRVLGREECSQLLRPLGITFDDRYLETVNTRSILERCVRNLVTIYAETSRQRELDLHERALEILRGKR